MRNWRFLSPLLLGLAWPFGNANAQWYKVDPEHTSVTFTVRHLLTKVRGRFDRFEGRIFFDPEHPSRARAEGTIEVASVNTNVEERDNDLRSPRFFDVGKFPKISFTTTKVTSVSPDKKRGKLEGHLTIHGVKRPVALDVSYLGAAKDPWGNYRAAFTARTTLNRKDFGLTWNEVLETGGVLVGDEVTIEIDAEAIRED